MARRTKEDAEKTKELLLQSAEFLFLEKGVAATSLEEIARHAGMTRGAVNWHFENKQALFDAMHERVCLPLEQDYQQVLQAENTMQAMREHCVYCLDYITHNTRVRNIMTILLLRCESTDPSQSNVERACRERDDIIDKFTLAFAKARDTRQIAAHIDPQTAAITLHALFHGLIHDIVNEHITYDVTALAPSIMDIFFGGLGIKANV